MLVIDYIATTSASSHPIPRYRKVFLLRSSKLSEYVALLNESTHESAADRATQSSVLSTGPRREITRIPQYCIPFFPLTGAQETINRSFFRNRRGPPEVLVRLPHPFKPGSSGRHFSSQMNLPDPVAKVSQSFPTLTTLLCSTKSIGEVLFASCRATRSMLALPCLQWRQRNIHLFTAPGAYDVALTLRVRMRSVRGQAKTFC